METAGQWLEKALLELCKKTERGLDLDADIISGLVSYCEMASPLDAKEYLDVNFSIYILLPTCFFHDFFSLFKFPVLFVVSVQSYIYTMQKVHIFEEGGLFIGIRLASVLCLLVMMLILDSLIFTFDG